MSDPDAPGSKKKVLSVEGLESGARAVESGLEATEAKVENAGKSAVEAGRNLMNDARKATATAHAKASGRAAEYTEKAIDGLWDGPKIEGTPGKKEIRLLERQVREMIATARSLGYDLAAANLEDWLTGRYEDGSKKLPPETVRGTATEHVAEVHRETVADGVEARLKASPGEQFPTLAPVSGSKPRCLDLNLVDGPNELQQNGSTTIYWQDSMTATYGTDLYFGLGAFTVHSEVTVSVTERAPDEATVTVEVDNWRCRVCDQYNWDLGKRTLVPLFGVVEDSDIKWLEKKGDAAPFTILTEYWNLTDPEITRPFEVTVPYSPRWEQGASQKPPQNRPDQEQSKKAR